MHAIKKILIEIFGLFVENGRFALAIIIWLGIVWLATPHLAIRTDAGGPFLFAGLALILIENTIRSSRSRRPRSTE